MKLSDNRLFAVLISLVFAGAFLRPMRAAASDFWLFGMLPPPHNQTTGVMQFKFAYVHAWDDNTFWSNDGSSKAGSEPKTAMPLRVVAGRFLAKLPVKKASELESEFLVRVWVSEGTAAFTRLTSDWRLIAASMSSGKNVPIPTEVQVSGTVFSTCVQKSDPVILASEKPMRIAIKWKTAGGAFEHEASDVGTVPMDAKGRVLLSSSFHCARGNMTHSGLRMPLQGLRKGGVTPDMLGNDLQSNASFDLKPVTPEAYGTQRAWQDSAGRKLLATLRDSDGAVVVLKGADGNLLLLDFNTLSAADQAHVKSMRGL